MSRTVGVGFSEMRRRLLAGAVTAVALWATSPAAPGAAQEPKRETIEADWMRYDAAERRVDLTIVTGLDGTNGGWNFNGYVNGDLTITVPLNARVFVTYSSRDAGVPHSAGIIEIEDPMPISGERVRFPFRGAFTHPFVAGLRAGVESKFDFVADKEGRYWLFCGVPPHGRAGMWVYFEVSKDVVRPVLKAVPKK